jgi:hypothetical protein
MSDAQEKNAGTGSYVVAGLGFIPLIGVLFAVVTIVLGIIKLKSGGKRLIVLGCCGISLTVVLYSSLFYFGFVQRGGIYDELRGKLAKVMLTELVKSIEYYKITKGQYPESLSQLKDSMGKAPFTSIYDPSNIEAWKNLGPKQAPTFFYQLTDDKSHYYLLGVGADQKPFTNDDLLPDLPDQDRANTGLLINPSSLPTK